MNIFEATQRPAPELLFRRNDPNDPRLGELARCDPAGYPSAHHVLMGCPQDMGVARNGGREGARHAPDAIRRMLYRLTPMGLNPASLFDLGNLIIQPDLEANVELHRAVVRQVLRDGKRLVVLGGGNDIAFPDCSALALECGPVLAFNIDAHLDVRADQPMNSGTPYRQLLDGGFVQPPDFFEMGFQPHANSETYLRYVRQLGAHAIEWGQLRAAGAQPPFQRALDASSAASIFWGFDMDAVRGADAPGVSAVNPLGLSAVEFVGLFDLAGAQPRTRIVELSEINPLFDVDDRTARLAAVAIHAYLRSATPSWAG